MKKTWKLRKNAEAVSPVIATILMVAITVVLAAVLYVMVMGFSQGGGANTPSVAMSKTATSTANQYRISLVSITSTTVKPTDITIIMTPSTGVTIGSWVLSTGTNLGAGDYFNVTGTTPSISYTIMLRYIPTSNSMGTLTFTAA
ncbi:MAG: type IV pilin N-terminal domain-containing protein [Methanomassiliicoccales archaeon]|nr:type IV pilin N-terminal domain-containing protein [Methanomassiliicoccales archaeon]